MFIFLIFSPLYFIIWISKHKKIPNPPTIEFFSFIGSLSDLSGLLLFLFVKLYSKCFQKIETLEQLPNCDIENPIVVNSIKNIN